jgi:hypothetical protein
MTPRQGSLKALWRLSEGTWRSCFKGYWAKAFHSKALWGLSYRSKLKHLKPGAGVSRASSTTACLSKALVRHAALVFTGAAPLTLVATALLLLYSCVTPHLLLLCFYIYIHIHMLIHIYIHIFIFVYMYALHLFYSCFTSRCICNCCNPALLEYIHLYCCFTRTLLVLFLLCVCVCAGLLGS